MYDNDESNVRIELTDDGLFLAYLQGRATTYALGETEEEARENLLDRYNFDAENFADADEYAYLSSAWG